MTKKPKILAGHKQVGKRFITPFNQMEIAKETSYVDRIMPELIWMDMINVTMGYKSGIPFTMEFCAAMRDPDAESFTNFTVSSNYAGLSEDKRCAALKRLTGSGLLDAISSAIAPLARIYADFPMAWLIDKDVGSGEDDIERISNSVDRIIDKYTYAASIVQANVIAFRAKSGAIFYANHIPLPDFNAMTIDFDSEAGRRAATHARIGAMMDIARDDSDQWPRSFWATNYRLTKCNIHWGEDG